MLVRIRKFLASDIFLILMAVIAAVIICVDQMLGTPVYYGLSIYFGFLCFFVLALSDDMLSMLGPALLMLSFVIQYKNSFDAYMEYLWGIPVVVICVILHIVLGHKSFVGLKISSLALFKPICFTSVALFLGGVGSLSLGEYFSTLSVVYMILLGPLAFTHIVISLLNFENALLFLLLRAMMRALRYSKALPIVLYYYFVYIFLLKCFPVN